MSTRSRIGILRDDGTIRSIYCHYDGYEGGVGQTLKDFYKDKETVEKLIALGNISTLGDRPISSPDLWDTLAFTRDDFSTYTVAYKDRPGETYKENMPYTSKNIKDFKDLISRSCTDYAYLFHPETGKWDMYKGETFVKVLK